MKALIPVLAILFFSACKKEENKIRYEVRCGSCDITYSNASEDTEQLTVSGFWNYDFNGASGQFCYISAQNNAETGTVSVQILRNGGVLKDASSSGAYVIATASGSVP